MKSPAGGKADYWKSLERSLIDGGWYTGTEEDSQPDQTWCIPYCMYVQRPTAKVLSSLRLHPLKSSSYFS
jgi:hypothetical protein